MVKSLKGSKVFILIAALTPIVISACSERPEEVSEELKTTSNLLDGTWITACLQNPSPVTDPDAPTGYFRETLEFFSLNAMQTLEYFQDADCNVAVTAEQVANLDETLFLLKQSQQFSLEYPAGTTITDLGEASFLNLQVESVSIDDVVQSEEQLQQNGIELNSLLGLFIVTESERLHLSTSVAERPVTVPLDFFFERVIE